MNVCGKFGGIGIRISTCVFLCFDECVVNVCCKFGGIGMKMAICVFCDAMNVLRMFFANLVGLG